MDQVVDLDSLATWVKVIVEKVILFRKVMPMAMENLPLRNIETPYDMHTHEVAVTNLRLNNLMLVTLCISNDNLMILWTLLPVTLS
jgi:hypothetical protein